MPDWISQTSPLDSNVSVQFDLFYPPVVVGDFYDQYRIPRTLPDSMVINALNRAYVKIMRDLDSFKTMQLAAGVTSINLGAAPADPFDDRTFQTLFFVRAVCCYAKAELLRESPTFFRLKDAANAAKSADETEDHYFYLSNLALRQILGDTKTITVECL